MGILRTVNTLQQISNCENVSTIKGVWKHICWQLRKLGGHFPVELKLSNSRIVIPRAMGAGALINSMGLYDYNNMNLIRKVLGLIGGEFLDVGANIGAYSLIASEIERARVIGFEPHPTTYAWLKRNVGINNRQNVETLNIALSDYTGEAFLTNGNDPSTNKIAQKKAYGSRAEMIKVPCVTLDDVCNSLKIKPGIVKIDVEGHEERVLRGFGKRGASSSLILVENGGSDTIKKVLVECWGFDGPWYFYFREGKFGREPQRKAEDPVYIGGAFTSELDRLGMRIG